MSTLNDGIVIPADPPATSVPAEPPTNSKFFTEEDLTKARQQEKDKLYKRIEDADSRVKAMEDQLSMLTSEREAAIKEASERAQKEAELLRQRELEELSAKELVSRTEEEFKSRLNQVELEWQDKFAKLEQERQAQEALLEKERYLQAVESYRQRRMSEESETIIPELRDFITGNNEEEIENSIAVLRDRSNAIIESIQQATQPGRLRSAPVTAPPIGPLDTQMEYQTLSAEDIRNMPMDQYVKMRDRLLKARPSRGRF
jgi:hypothetical protein